MIETKDLILKKGEPDDWRDMYINLWSHEESARYMLWNVTTSEEEAKQRMLRSIEFQKDKTAYFVYEKKSGMAIGFAGMREIKPGVYEDTGIAVGPDFVGKGYGKQILNALVTTAFGELGAKKFVYTCREQNTASKRLALSYGFKYDRFEERTDDRTGEKYILVYYYLYNIK